MAEDIETNDTGSGYLRHDTTDTGSGYMALLLSGCNLNGLSQTTSFSDIQNESNPWGVDIDNNGNNMWIAAEQRNDFIQYTLSTAYDITSASEEGSVNSNGSTPYSITWKDDGTKAYWLDSSVLYEYSVDTAYDLLSGLTQENKVSQDNAFKDHIWKPDGTKYYQCAENIGIWQRDPDAAWSISNIPVEEKFKAGGEGARGMEWANEGEDFYICETQTPEIRHYTVDPDKGAWNIGGSPTLQETMSPQKTEPQEILWHPDCEIFWELDSDGSTVYEYKP